MAGGVTEKGSRSRIRITRLVDGKQVVIKDVKLEDPVLPGDSIEVMSQALVGWACATLDHDIRHGQTTHARRARRERPALRRHRADARDDGAGAARSRRRLR